MTGAVIYIRVSTEEQANGALNLPNQEKRCREYCEKNELQVVKVFVEPGASARSLGRPEFQKMLEFCRLNRRNVRFVIVQDLSRFARNLQDQAQTINELARVGVLLRSTYESNIDETAAGKLAANIYGTFNQFFSDALSEKMRDRTRESVLAGRFPWRAPLGYRNVGGTSGANIIPDSDTAPFIQKAFELIATGMYKKADVLSELTKQGFRNAKGETIPPQTFQMILRNSLYAGWIRLPSDSSFEPVRGLHEPLVSQELFDQVQRVLDGKSPKTFEKRKHNPNFPLKLFMRCAECGIPLTGGFSRGKSRHYAYYRCRNNNCSSAKSIKREELENAFLKLLERAALVNEANSEMPAMLKKVWIVRHKELAFEKKRVSLELNNLKKKKQALVGAFLEGRLRQTDYEDFSQNLNQQIDSLEARNVEFVDDEELLSSFLRFAELSLSEIAGIWKKGHPESRQKIQRLLFPEGLRYSTELGILNPSNSSLFKLLEKVTDENECLAYLNSASLNSLRLLLVNAEELWGLLKGYGSDVSEP